MHNDVKQCFRCLNVHCGSCRHKSNINLLLTEREGRTGRIYIWNEVLTVRAERIEVCTEKTKGRYSENKNKFIKSLWQ